MSQRKIKVTVVLTIDSEAAHKYKDRIESSLKTDEFLDQVIQEMDYNFKYSPFPVCPNIITDTEIRDFEIIDT